jgi:hypothetical protein
VLRAACWVLLVQCVQRAELMGCGSGETCMLPWLVVQPHVARST